MSVEVTYSTETPQDEIRRLTSFNLTCLTRRHPCTRVEDLLPIAEPWHLYPLDGDPPIPKPHPVPPTACRVPVWALGRDAITILEVQALSASQKESSSYDGSTYEEDKVALDGVIKGKAPWKPGTMLRANPYSGDSVNPPFTAPEHLLPDHRYLALIVDRISELDADYHPPPEALAARPGVNLDRCGVLDDTPENRLELQKGIAQNDQLRVPEF